MWDREDAVEGGNLPASNVVPDKVVLTGTVRAYDKAVTGPPQVGQRASGEMVASVCAAHRAAGRTALMNAQLSPVVNTAAEVEFAR